MTELKHEFDHEAEKTLPCLTRERVRMVDQLAVESLGLPSLVLMENAARGLSDVLRLTRPNGRILILCGHGNNGGDGLALMRLLAAANRKAVCGLVSPDKGLSHDAEANRAFLANSGIVVPRWSIGDTDQQISSLSADDTIVDAMLGTGVRGTVQAPFDAIITSINHSPAAVIAADVPSGLDCDTGQPCGCAVRASHTVTFVARKAGFNKPHAGEFTGAITVCNIGIPWEWLCEKFPELDV